MVVINNYNNIGTLNDILEGLNSEAHAEQQNDLT